MGGERGDAGFSATSKSGSTSLFNIGWLVAVLEVGAHGKGDKPVMTCRTVVVLGPAAITIEDKRARDTPDTSQEIVVFLCTIVSPRYLISSLSSPTGLSHANVPSRRRRKVRLIRVLKIRRTPQTGPVRSSNRTQPSRVPLALLIPPPPCVRRGSGRGPRESLDAPENLPKERVGVKWLSASSKMK